MPLPPRASRPSDAEERARRVEVAFAEAAVDQVEPIFRSGLGAQPARFKGQGDFATEVDLVIEQQLRDILTQMTGIPVYGEESGGSVLDTVWVVDPIDGTANYSAGNPMAGILVALWTFGGLVLEGEFGVLLPLGRQRGRPVGEGAAVVVLKRLADAQRDNDRVLAVVAHPDGDLEAYLGSLERIERLTASGEVTSLLPGHGPSVADAAGVVGWYQQHRRERLEQVAAAAGRVQPGPGEDLADAVVRTVYADVPREVWPAARLTVLAQLEYLRTQR